MPSFSCFSYTPSHAITPNAISCIQVPCNLMQLQTFHAFILMRHNHATFIHAFNAMLISYIAPVQSNHGPTHVKMPTGIVYALPEHIPIGHVPVLTHTLLGLWATNPMEPSHQSCAGLRSFTDGLHPNLLSVPLFPKPILTRKSLLTHHGPMPYPTSANPTHTMPNSHYANSCHAMSTCNICPFLYVLSQSIIPNSCQCTIHANAIMPML